MLTTLERELQNYAVRLFEQCGGIAEWPERAEAGSVVVPPELAAAAELPGEEFTMAGQVRDARTLQVGLAGEFLEVAARVMEKAVPRDGRFCIPDRYLTSRDLSAKIAQTFAWQNARGKCGSAEPALAEYHVWTMLATLRSEDVWESLIRVVVNAESQAVVEMPDIFREPDLTDGQTDRQTDDPAEEPPGVPASWQTAVAEGRRQLITASVAFVRRVEQRLERDRKRLQDYYRALSREAGASKRRAASPPSPEEVAAKQRAVELELRRKLGELNERYAFEAVLHPVMLVRVRIPVLVVPVTIQRKQAVREYRVYWNSLQKKLEPLSCLRCGISTWSGTFTNETVDLLCAACAAER
jgi:hypothetical protein